MNLTGALLLTGRRFLALIVLLLAGLVPAQAQDFPALSGRVVDQAELLSPEQEAALTAKLAALEQASSRQLVIATIASLQDRAIEDYGVALARHWRIGQEGANNGVVLIVAPNERKVRIEVGYGLEGVLTDALSSSIIRNQMTLRFREGDFPGGIAAGADAIIEQLQAPPEAAEERVRAAAAEQAGARRSGATKSWILPLIFFGVALVFILLPALFGRRGRGRRYRSTAGAVGEVVLWGLVNSLASGRGGGGSWGGGGFGGGGGGFSGGGGSFGGGGASGSW